MDCFPHLETFFACAHWITQLLVFQLLLFLFNFILKLTSFCEPLHVFKLWTYVYFSLYS